jgi:hypothetical protein
MIPPAARGRARVDFALWGGLVPGDLGRIDQLHVRVDAARQDQQPAGVDLGPAGPETRSHGRDHPVVDRHVLRAAAHDEVVGHPASSIRMRMIATISSIARARSASAALASRSCASARIAATPRPRTHTT